MTVGFRIKQSWDRIDPALVEKFKSIPVANVGDCMWRMYAGSNALRPMHKETRGGFSTGLIPGLD